jgi:cytidylate kinase
MGNNKVNTIALDGPAACGKTTVGQRLAKKIGYLFFDTGVMYRAVTLEAIESGIAVDDENACTTLAEETRIDIRPPSMSDGRLNDILINGEDKTWDIRKPEVDANVSVVSAYPGVRQALTLKQREIGLRGEVVMAGRDIGTVVLPESRLKIFLDASVEERARRRYLERLERGEESDYANVLDVLKSRDEIDSTRDVAPLQLAEDAIMVDSDDKTIERVVDEIMGLVRAKGMV